MRACTDILRIDTDQKMASSSAATSDTVAQSSDVEDQDAMTDAEEEQLDAKSSKTKFCGAAKYHSR